jgi:ribosomal protein L5
MHSSLRITEQTPEKRTRVEKIVINEDHKDNRGTTQKKKHEKHLTSISSAEY